MARSVWGAWGIVMGVLLAAGPVSAQPVVILPDHITFGGVVSASTKVGAAGRELAASLELPVYWPYRVRIDAGRSGWETPGHMSTDRGDIATLARGTVSVIKAIDPRRLGKPVGTYGGLGVGVYKYAARRGEPAHIMSGCNLLGGVELTLPNDRVVLGWEIQGLLTAGKTTQNLLALQAGMAVRYRF